MRCDFPKLEQQSPEMRAQNQKMAQHYGVTEYPVLILVNAQGLEPVTISPHAKNPAMLVRYIRDRMEAF